MPPTVIFFDERGQQRSYRPPLGANLPVLTVGKVYSVRYDPADPSVVVVGTDWASLAIVMGGLLCTGVGSVFLLIELLLF